MTVPARLLELVDLFLDHVIFDFCEEDLGSGRAGPIRGTVVTTSSHFALARAVVKPSMLPDFFSSFWDDGRGDQGEHFKALDAAADRVEHILVGQRAAIGDPRFLRVEIDVAKLRQFHDYLGCPAQAKMGIGLIRFFGELLDFVQKLLVLFMEMFELGDLSFAVVLGEDKGAVDEVAVFAKEFAVASGLKIFPGEFGVLAFGGIRGDRIADLVGGELLEEGFKIDVPVVRLAELSPFQIVKFIGGKLIDEFVRGVLSHDHRGKKHGVEWDVVFADELDVVGLGVEPIVFPGVGFVVLSCAHSWVAEI